jgi:Na+/H+-dicarboxylate symporter
VSLATQVLLGLFLGIGTGIFFGDLIAPVGVVGRAFILLLQMTVLPYVTVSLVVSVGSLSYADARALARSAGSFLLLLWGITLVMVLLVPLSFPNWPAASFFSSTLVEQRQEMNFLDLYIPSNPFRSLSETVVPAVVFFSIALGVALIGIERKQALIEPLDALLKALVRITEFVVSLAPYGIFAIAANAAGTMDLQQARALQVYATSYGLAALLLSLWVLPGLLSVLTPFRYGQVMGLTRDALVTAFATGSLFVVLSLLGEKCKQLLRAAGPEAAAGEYVTDVVVPASFNFPSVGKLLPLMFIPFAGWVSGFGVSLSEMPNLLGAGLVSFFGSTMVAVPFLLDLLRIPADTFQLFVVADSIVGRLGTLAAAVHTLVLTLLSACAMQGLIRVRPLALLRFTLITVVLTVAMIGGVRLSFEAMGTEYVQYDRFISRSLLYEPVRYKVLEGPPEQVPRDDRGAPVLQRVQSRGVLRVGYGKDALPFAFQNDRGELVGFDVDMAHLLARQLGVRLELVRIDLRRAAELLDAGYLDLVMSGLMITPDKLQKMSLSMSYLDETLAFIVRDFRREEFNSRKAVRAHEELAIGIPSSQYYRDMVSRYLPNARVEELRSPREFFTKRSQELDALVYSAERGASWSLIYPQFAVAVPHPDVVRVPVAYAMPLGDQDMLVFMNRWLELKEKDGTRGALFAYWFRGERDTGATRRWSIIRDVLGWID